MDDLIVIILTIAIGIVGVIRQSKKKKENQAATDNGNTSSDFWDMLVDDEETAPQPVVNDIHISPEANVTTKQEQIEETIIQPIKHKTRKPTKAMKRKIRDEQNSKSKTGKFSLRKAVIYSEILNRKYT
jgi:hypothetical protein